MDQQLAFVILVFIGIAFPEVLLWIFDFIVFILSLRLVKVKGIIVNDDNEWEEVEHWAIRPKDRS